MYSGHPDLAWRKWSAPPSDLNGPTGAFVDPTHGEITERPLISSLALVAGQRPDKIAVYDGKYRLSYRDLAAWVSRLSARLSAKVPAGAAVAVLSPSGVGSIVAQLACVAAGVVSLIPNMSNPAERLASMLADSGAVACIDGAAEVIEILGLPAIALECDDAIAGERSSLGLDEPAFVFYTSGSTGRPKGIVRSQRQTLMRAVGKILQLHLHSDDRILSLFNCAFTPGLMAWQVALLTGASVHVIDIGAIGMRTLLDYIQRECITLLMGTPTVLRLSLELASREKLASVRAVFTTGEPLLRADITDWRRVLPDNCCIAAGYAMTEVTPIGEWFVPLVLPQCGARLPAGYPDLAHDYALADEDGGRCPDGQPGVLWLRGRFISLGEWQHGRCFPGRFLPDPLDRQSRIFCTGDVVRVRADGLLEVHGRADRQLKIRGNRIDPAEIEEVLRSVDGVAEASVISKPVAGEMQLVAFIVPVAQVDRDLLQTAIMARVRQRLPGSMRPTRLRFLASLPRLPSGKLDRAALSEVV